MTALAEALLAAQRQAIGALAKPYVAGVLDEEPAVAMLTVIGCTDVVDRAQLLACWDILREYGAPAPRVTEPKPDPETEPASDAQRRFIADLADRAQTTAPDGPLTKAQASTVIEQLKAGTYNPDEWTVPF